MERISIFEFEAVNTANVTSLFRFSDQGTVVNNFYYEPRLKDSLIYSENGYLSSALNLQVSTDIGRLTLINTDGAYDYLMDFAIVGRTFNFYFIVNGAIEPVSAVVGIISNVSFEDSNIEISLRSRLANLDEQMELASYLGNNIAPDGFEGDSNLVGVQKPQVYGNVLNAQPILVNASRLIYQVHSGYIPPGTSANVAPAILNTVRDRGVGLTRGTSYTNDITAFYNNPPAAGSYTVLTLSANDNQRGLYIRLGAQPTGTVTCDVTRFANQPGTILNNLIIHKRLSLNSASINALNLLEATPNSGLYYDLGFYVKERTRISDLVSAFLTSINHVMFLQDKANGILATSRLTTTTAVVEKIANFKITDDQIYKLDVISNGVGNNSAPVYKTTFRIIRNQTPQNDLAGAVSASVRELYSKEWRAVNYLVQPIKTRFPTSEEVVIDTMFMNIPEAQVEVNRLGMLIGKRLDTVEITCQLTPELAANMRPGNFVFVKSSKKGYNGVIFTLIGYTLDMKRSRATLRMIR